MNSGGFKLQLEYSFAFPEIIKLKSKIELGDWVKWTKPDPTPPKLIISKVDKKLSDMKIFDYIIMKSKIY